ncbi:hypothetical protein [Fluviicola chungangensis]|uniref:Uncharacterized protein n=1 Tax=Fluviicola chungangensis TaxID=2597671 RepID=A0A556N0D6_9FLAO|nr:hypothetical protein [Fluviicola chungangensis]TSJ45650.1 hypothetical protein FO442_07805 [Fluviicola chungangensis]
MKKLLTLTTFSLLVLVSLAEPPVKKWKSDRGLFGYKTVTQTNSPDLIMLSCRDPGLIACRAQGITVVGDDGEISLTETNIESIERMIDDLVLSGKNSGTIVYDDKVVITFLFNEDADDLEYTLYSVPQARRYGVNF